MKVLLLVLCFVVGSLAFPHLNLQSQEWKAFKEFHRKAYKGIVEELFRLKIYLKNKLSILAHNIKYKIGKSLYEVEMNKFGDLLQHEFKNVSTGFNVTLPDTESDTEPDTKSDTEPDTEPDTKSDTEPDTEPEVETRALRPPKYVPKQYVSTGKRLPAAVDCRRRGQVNTPRYQGACNGCWAFATTGAIEGQIARKTGKLLALSQQHLIDCSKENFGCNGGQMVRAYKYVMENGLVAESDYPYFRREVKCRFSRKKIVATITGFVNIEEDNEKDLQDALAFVGPVAIGIDSSNPMMPFYRRGIFSPTFETCSYRAVDHAVLAIGYGKQHGVEYWIIKNSWGTGWGEQGYMKLLKNGENLCGVATKASLPLVD